MEQVYRIFKQIQETSGLNDKKAIIRENKDNELFKQCLIFLLDSNITTGISDKKWNKTAAIQTDAAVNTFPDLIRYIQEHNSGRECDVAVCKGWCINQILAVQMFAKQLITKKFRLGCDKKVINSVIPQLIPTWDVQQAYPIDGKNSPKRNEWFALSQKLNGTNNGVLDGKCISRQGKEFTGMQHIIHDIAQLSFKDMFFNGELIRKNEDNLPDDENFQIGTGIINSDESDKTDIKFVIYEMLPKDEFLKGESKLTYKARRQTYLEPLAQEIHELGLTNIEVVPLVYQGTDTTQIQEWLQKADEMGWEGCMLNKDTKWKNKRNNGILKIKSFKHSDVRCTGMTEGEGKYQNMLGMITCDYKGYELGVGSGFTNEQRRYYWTHPEAIVNKIVQIKYKGETKNKQGGLSVQFPIFELVREDKTESSYE